jgi:hypothetical protein
MGELFGGAREDERRGERFGKNGFIPEISEGEGEFGEEVDGAGVFEREMKRKLALNMPRRGEEGLGLESFGNVAGN